MDGDARLSQDEFIGGLKPVEPYSRIAKRQKEKVQNPFTEKQAK